MNSTGTFQNCFLSGPSMYQPTCLVPCCQGKPGELETHSLQNLLYSSFCLLVQINTIFKKRTLASQHITSNCPRTTPPTSRRITIRHIDHNCCTIFLLSLSSPLHALWIPCTLTLTPLGSISLPTGWKEGMVALAGVILHAADVRLGGVFIGCPHRWGIGRVQRIRVN